jgi:hypothetical protein
LDSKDHLRVYGPRLCDRLAEAGFIAVDALNVDALATPEDATRMKLTTAAVSSRVPSVLM